MSRKVLLAATIAVASMTACSTLTGAAVGGAIVGATAGAIAGTVADDDDWGQLETLQRGGRRRQVEGRRHPPRGRFRIVQVGIDHEVCGRHLLLAGQKAVPQVSQQVA